MSEDDEADNYANKYANLLICIVSGYEITLLNDNETSQALF